VVTGEGVCETVGKGVCETVGEGVCETIDEGVCETVGEGVCETVGEGVCETVRVAKEVCCAVRVRRVVLQIAGKPEIALPSVAHETVAMTALCVVEREKVSKWQF
jgi:hypothetical protein